ncbi:MAG: hypothetical protein JKY42_06820, partial [Flavobacteriales bacterium]|nr:hypothetical protein [Flavobacteriales bacterium]
METKKTEKANLEPKKRRFFFIGLTIALASTLAAFEWGTTYEHIPDYGGIEGAVTMEEDWSEVTWRKEAQKIKLKTQVKHNSNDIDVVPDERVSQLEGNEEPEFPIFDEIDNYGYGGEEKPVIEELPPVKWAEAMPSFQCSANSDDAVFKYLARNIRYPRMAKDNGIEGTVYIEFTIN